MAKSSEAVQRKEQKTKGGEVVTIEGAATELKMDGEVGHLPEGFGSTTTLAIALARAEIDQQIATARSLPRDIRLAMKNINTMATLDEQTAKECIYALPRGGTPIRGPSIRLAEIIFQNWGNCRAGARVVHVDKHEKYVEAEGQFHDLQTNALRVARTRRPIQDKNGRVYNDDMINMTSNAAQAIAMRNAILAGVPRGVWRQAYEAVEKVLAGSVKTLNQRRAEAVKAFATWGITPEQLLTKLNLKTLDEISNDDVVTLVGLFNAIKNQETTVEEVFKDAPSKPEPPKATDTKKPAAKEDTPHDGETGEVLLAFDDAEFGIPDALAWGRKYFADKKPARAPEEIREKGQGYEAAFKEGYDAAEADANARKRGGDTNGQKASKEGKEETQKVKET